MNTHCFSFLPLEIRSRDCVLSENPSSEVDLSRLAEKNSSVNATLVSTPQTWSKLSSSQSGGFLLLYK